MRLSEVLSQVTHFLISNCEDQKEDNRYPDLPITYYYQDNASGKYIAVDNRTSDCWVEEFDTEAAAKAYVEEPM